MKKVDRCLMTDTNLLSLFSRIEAVVEGYINAGHEIISINFIPNTQPNMAVIFHSYNETIN